MYRHIQLDQLFKMLVHHTRAKTNDKRTPPPPITAAAKAVEAEDRADKCIDAIVLSQNV